MNTDLVSSSSVFTLNGEHNGTPCVISTRPEDQGTEHQIWFTRQMLREIFDVKSDNTISNHVETLLNRGVVTVVKNLTTVQVANQAGAVNSTTLYDLKVFNFLAMRLDTDRAWEVKEKFSDILVEKETKSFPIPETFEDALILAGQQMKLAKEEERKRIQAEQERDEAVKKRKAINDKRTATLMVAKREDNKKIKALTNENDELKEQNKDLQKEKDKLLRSFGCTPEKHDWLTIAMMSDIWKKEFKKQPQWQDLKRIIKENDLVEPIRDVKEFVNNTERLVNRYPRRAWEMYYDEELERKERKNQTEE